MTTAAEENEALQWVVGTEVETINQQLADFKVSLYANAFLKWHSVLEALSGVVVFRVGPLFFKLL